MKKLLILFAFLLSTALSFAQDMFGIANSNYAGLNGVSLNPSAIVDSRLNLDVNIITVGLTMDNDYLYIPKKNLGFFGFGGIVDNAQEKYTGYTDLKNYPGDSFRGMDLKGVNLGVLLRGPSVMFHIKKNWFALCYNIRGGASISDVNYSVAKVAYEDAGLHYEPLQDRVLNSGAISIGAMLWREYALTYGREILNKGKDYLKGAVTIKYIGGYAAAYFKTPGFDYRISEDTAIGAPVDTTFFYNANATYGHSFNEDLEGKSSVGGDLINGHGWGFDIGFTYEYRPDYQSYKYDMDGEKIDDPLKNKYKWKIGASAYDLGKINFDKNAEAFNLRGNGVWLGWDTAKINGVTEFDTTFSNVFYALDHLSGFANSSNDGKHEFDMALPHALSLQFDYYIGSNFYANATWIGRIKSDNPGLVSSNNIAVTPRFEKKGIEVAVPLSYYNYDQFRVGLALRLGSIFIVGSDKIGSVMGLADLGGMDFYTSLKFAIGRHKVADKDRDGVSDKLDKCPDQPGPWATQGCPDADGDGFIDSQDDCPSVPGIAAFKGCPDTDGDGIMDKEDECPDIAGLLLFKGCPDTDGDSIPDHQDSCATVKGLLQFHGCPDTDGDGIIDMRDSCPDEKGLPRFQGCPDTDGDDLIDKLDSCPNVKGPISNKGCPIVETVAPKEIVPVKPTLTKEEEEVIAKVFRNLEFETGKSVIRQSSYPSLNELVELLKNKPSYRLLVDGHTDNVGGAAMNMKLSANRANAVKTYLTERGIAPDRITATGYGLTRPVASNKTVEGRQRNRRVEFTIVQ